MRLAASTFEILPAIDLLDGRVVRLQQGDFDRFTDYGDDPARVAAAFAAAGARWLHVVDLDAARDPADRNDDVIREIVRAVGHSANVELAGGLRTIESLTGAVGQGAARVVVGTAALADVSFAERAVAAVGRERLAVALDVRDGYAVGQAWREGAPGEPAAEALVRLAAAGVATFEVTAIERDGLLEGPDLGLLAGLVHLGAGQIVASGGIASADDVRAVRDAGCAGVIVGRALYEGRVTLAELLLV
jgi:phosphoribosylformimino-5-aminoimidazole carboxamide ribotide isomerase